MGALLILIWLYKEVPMPSEKQCMTARQATGSRTSNDDINVQYSMISGSERFLMSRSVEKLLKTHGVSAEEGWMKYKKELEDIALDYLVDSATAFCLYMDWKRSRQ